MSLKDLVLATEQVTLNEGSFEVRGLSIADLVNLMESDIDALVALFDKKGVNWATFIRQFPQFTAKVIAFAADEPGEFEKVLRLPAGSQIQAISKVWNLTAIDVGTVGKALSSLVGGLENLNDQLEKQQTPKVPSGISADT